MVFIVFFLSQHVGAIFIDASFFFLEADWGSFRLYSKILSFKLFFREAWKSEGVKRIGFVLEGLPFELVKLLHDLFWNIRWKMTLFAFVRICSRWIAALRLSWSQYFIWSLFYRLKEAHSELSHQMDSNNFIGGKLSLANSSIHLQASLRRTRS